MQRHRIGRGQRPVDATVRPDDADRAQGRRLAPAMSVDLTCELSDGGFAAGAGDRDGSVRLTAVKRRCHQRQCPARIGGANHRHRTVGDNRAIQCKHRDGAGSNRLTDERRAIDDATRHCRKHRARLNQAAVGRNRGNIDPGDVTVHRRFIGLQVREEHGCAFAVQCWHHRWWRYRVAVL